MCLKSLKKVARNTASWYIRNAIQRNTKIKILWENYTLRTCRSILTCNRYIKLGWIVLYEPVLEGASTNPLSTKKNYGLPLKRGHLLNLFIDHDIWPIKLMILSRLILLTFLLLRFHQSAGNYTQTSRDYSVVNLDLEVYQSLRNRKYMYSCNL